MDNDVLLGGWLPTPQQQILLAAALLPQEQAADAWNEWCREVDFENDFIDHGSFRLFSLVYRNLVSYDQDLPEMTRLAGIYKRGWYLNQLIASGCREIFRDFDKAGIRWMLLKGIPVGQLYYDDVGARPMSDADVLIYPDDMQQALQLLYSGGFIAETHDGSVSAGCFNIVHSVGFEKKEHIELDVHSRVFRNNYSGSLTQDIWNQADSFNYNGHAVKTLSPEYHLVHTCAHGFAWNSMPPIRWIADAVKILSTTDINWTRLVDSAIRFDLHADIVQSLEYLRDVWGQSIPDQVIAELKRAPTSTVKKKLLLAVSRPQRSPLRRLYRLWIRHEYYCLSKGYTGLPRTLFKFPGYCKEVLGFRTYSALVGKGVSTLAYYTRRSLGACNARR